EVAIDSWALWNMLAPETGEVRFELARDLARSWLQKVALDREQHRWNRGFFKSADKQVATDIHAWGISALGVDGLEALEPGLAEKMAAVVEQHCEATGTFQMPRG